MLHRPKKTITDPTDLPKKSCSMFDCRGKHSGKSGAKNSHIEMKHPFDYLMLTGLDFQEFKFYITNRRMVERLIQEGVITGQGKKDKNGIANPQQAYWFEISNFAKQQKKFTDYFTELTDEQSLIDYIQADSSVSVDIL